MSPLCCSFLSKAGPLSPTHEMSLTLRFHVPIFLLLLLPLITIEASDSTPLHQVLRNHGLPAGLFPVGVKSYKLDQNGALEVHLGHPCLAHYETAVFFDSVVKANLSFGQLKVFKGMSREELFLWLPVKDIIVTDPSNGLILIDIGFALKHLAFSRFDVPPTCVNPSGIGLALKIGGRKGGFSDQ